MYNFTNEQLNILQEVHDNKLFGPRAAYARYHNIENDIAPGVPTEKIEDFIISFYTQYNEKISNRY